jgi:hypothetical protein
MVEIHGATITATQCEFMENGANTKGRLNDCTMHHNGQDGLFAYYHAVVDLHGTKTDIHSNKRRGISASDRGKVNIHLPFQHNTPRQHQRRRINADGTFTHVVNTNRQFFAASSLLTSFKRVCRNLW